MMEFWGFSRKQQCRGVKHFVLKQFARVSVFQQVQDLYTAAYNTGDPVLVCYELAKEHVHFSPEGSGHPVVDSTLVPEGIGVGCLWAFIIYKHSDYRYTSILAEGV